MNAVIHRTPGTSCRDGRSGEENPILRASIIGASILVLV